MLYNTFAVELRKMKQLKFTKSFVYKFINEHDVLVVVFIQYACHIAQSDAHVFDRIFGHLLKSFVQ
jgi:hypothetical protein